MLLLVHLLFSIFIIGVSELCQFGWQIKSDAYVCVLCQKRCMDFGSIPSVEDGELATLLDKNDLKTVCSDSIISSQLPSRNGKVCNLLYKSKS